MAACNRINKKLDEMADSYAPPEYPAPTYVMPWQTTANTYFNNQPQPYFHQPLPPPNTHQPTQPPDPPDWQCHSPTNNQPTYTSSASLNTYQPPPPPPNTCQQHTYKQRTYLLDMEPYGQPLNPTYTDPYRQLKSQPYTDPWRQDQLIYRPPSPTEWPSPPPQHQPCWSSTSHCRTAAPLPAAAVVQPLQLPPPAESSPQCSPATSAFGSPPDAASYTYGSSCNSHPGFHPWQPQNCSSRPLPPTERPPSYQHSTSTYTPSANSPTATTQSRSCLEQPIAVLLPLLRPTSLRRSAIPPMAASTAVPLPPQPPPSSYRCPPLITDKKNICEVQVHEYDGVNIHYKRKRTDGTIFDPTFQRGDPIDIELSSGQVIKQWLLVLGMCLGEKRKLKIPSKLNYGEHVFDPGGFLVVASWFPP